MKVKACANTQIVHIPSLDSIEEIDNVETASALSSKQILDLAIQDFIDTPSTSTMPSTDIVDLPSTSGFALSQTEGSASVWTEGSSLTTDLVSVSSSTLTSLQMVC